MNKKIISATASLIGAVIGAGLFVLPHFLKEGGWLTFLICLIIFGGGMILCHLLLAEIILRTKKRKYFTGYVGKYLGERARRLSFLYLFPGLVGALLVYMLMVGQFLFLFGQPWLKIPPFYGSLALLVFASLLVFRKEKMLLKTQSASSFFLAVILLATIGYAAFKINPDSLIAFGKSFPLGLPGIIFFSLTGWNALPMMARILTTPENKKKMGAIILFSLGGVALLYFLFSLALTSLGVDIINWSQIDYLSVSSFYLVKVLALIGLIAGAASFFSLGNYLKNSLVVDYHFPNRLAIGATILAPLLLYLLLGSGHLLSLMGIVGAFLGSLQGGIILLIFLKARKRGNRPPEYCLRNPRLAAGYMVFTLIAVTVLQIISLLRG
jgi:amino acid permease